MSRVFHLYNIIQLIIDRFNQALFLSKILSTILINGFFILFFNFSDKLYAIKKKVLKQSLDNISLVCT